MPADSPAELFDVVDPATGAALYTAPRADCHARGLWHRSVYVFVTDPAGCHLLQQRAPTKDVAPSRWDVAATEHVAAGESVTAAAVRGLSEELGITVDAARLGPALAPPRRAELRTADGVWDRELVTTFWLQGWEGGVTPDASEVAAVRWATADEVRALVAAGGDGGGGDAVTPWLVEAVAATPQVLMGGGGE